MNQVGSALVAHDCGLGKTLIAVTAVARVAKGPILVVAPRLTKLQWRWVIEDQGAGYVGVCGRAGREVPWSRVANWGSRKPLIWVIVHPAAVRLSLNELRGVKWDTIIVDEAHSFKNRKAQQTKALSKVPAKRRIALTATPYGNNPADMWAILHWLYPKKYTSYWNFYNAYVSSFTPPGQGFRIVTGTQNLEQLAREIAPFYLKRRKDEVLDLPEITYSDVQVDLGPKQEQLYVTLEKEAYTILGGEEVILQNALTRIVRLQQCALDPSLMIEGTIDVGTLAKLEWLQEWLELHPEEPVVIVSRFRRFTERWLRQLSSKACIVGGLSQQGAQLALQEFGRTGRLVGTLDAIKLGLNLERASTLIVMDGTYSATSEYQLSQRIHRIGQTRNCQVIHLVATLPSYKDDTTVDHLIRKAVEKKLSEAQLIDEFIRKLKSRRW